MSSQERTEECVVDVLRTAELRKGEPEHNDSLEEVVECYSNRSARILQR